MLLNKHSDDGWPAGGRLLRYDTQTKSETLIFPLPSSSRSLVVVKQILYEFYARVNCFTRQFELDIVNMVKDFFHEGYVSLN